MPNIPGASGILPQVVSDVVTVSRGASVPSGVRIASIIGEGSRSEVIVSSAVGGGSDGLNSNYTSVSGADGRHFTLSLAPIIAARTSLFRAGVLLTGLEEAIDSLSFDSRYDYRIDIATGHIEMQTAHIVNQGGADYVVSSTNVGDGYLQTLTLPDVNAPTENWTIKCVSVQRDGGGVPISGTAKFIAFGSVSGQKLDSLGNPVVWVSNGIVVSNSILSFAIFDSSIVFVEGDTFTVKVSSGVLNKNDSLSASYIAVSDIDDPTFLTSMQEITAKHGAVSLDNNLSLGCQLAFANNTPGIMCVQAAPPVPRRTSYQLITDFIGPTDGYDTDFQFPLPLGVAVDPNSEIHFFITNPATSTETQILPNKLTYFTLDTGGSNPSTSAFIHSNTPAPGGFSYFYTVKQSSLSLATGTDGYLNVTSGTTGIFSSVSFTFDSSYVGKSVIITDALVPANNGTFVVSSVSSGKLHLIGSGWTTSETGLRFNVVDTSSKSDYIVINHNVVPAGYALRVTLITLADAEFFDAGWLNALSSLETEEIDILVPLPKQTKSVIFQNALSHCRTMSNIKNKKERVLFTGAISGLLPANLTGADPAAVEDLGILEGIQGDTVVEILAGNTEDLTDYSVVNAYGNTFRVAYFYPDQIVAQVGADNQFLDGFYIGAAAAGYLSAIPNVSIPLTGKTLSGFTILKNKKLKPIVEEQVAAAGVAIVRPVAGGGKVAWGKTTTQSGSPEEEEISIVFIRDRVAKNLRTGFEGYIGMPEDTDTPLVLNARAVALLNAFVSQKLITDWKDLKVVRDAVEPRQWNISMRVQPVYPVNWIYIKVGIGLL